MADAGRGRPAGRCSRCWRRSPRSRRRRRRRARPGDRQQERPAPGGALRARPRDRHEPRGVFAERGIATKPSRSRRRSTARLVAARERAVPRSAPRESRFAAGRVPVFANTTGRPYPDDADAARALLADQLARPVEFVARDRGDVPSRASDLPRSRPRRQADRPGRRDPRRPPSTHALAVDASRGAAR